MVRRGSRSRSRFRHRIEHDRLLLEQTLWILLEPRWTDGSSYQLVPELLKFALGPRAATNALMTNLEKRAGYLDRQLLPDRRRRARRSRSMPQTTTCGRSERSGSAGDHTFDECGGTIPGVRDMVGRRLDADSMTFGVLLGLPPDVYLER